MSLAILADDLTGAADCAARCRGAGLPTTIELRPPTLPFPPGVTAFTSDTRHLPSATAGARVYELLAGMRAPADVTWYKKIDSTLRGNVGAELDAMLDALGRNCALVCPAFPAQGRGLSDGWLVSSVAQPTHLPALLAQQSRRPIAAIALADVRAGAERLAQRFAAARAAAQLLAVDALTDEDLCAILAAADRVLPGALLCGSAGLVGALAARCQPSASSGTASDASLPAASRALLVVGSGSAAARRQIAYLRQHHRVETVEIDPAAAKSDQRPTTNDQQPANQEAGRRRRETGDQATTGYGLRATDYGLQTEYATHNTHHGDVLLHLPEPPAHAALDGPEARRLAADLAAATLPIVAQLRPALLILVGGDTATHVLDGLGVERLEVSRELLPGIPLANGVTIRGRKQLVILKPGNYGGDETLATLLRMMRNAKCEMQNAET
jgi:uncharacterized protein YgbK (DUF1537 family)